MHVPPRPKSPLKPTFRPHAKVSATTEPKPPRVRAIPSASTSRASSTVGRNPPSAPATPDTRPRVAAPALHHAASTTSLASAPPRLLSSSRSTIGLAGRASPTPPPRIRAKVSAVASPHSPVAHAPTPSPPILRARAPSATSQPPPQFYPITTAAPAANPHRFAPPRPPPPHSSLSPRTSPVPPHQPFQAFRASNGPSSSTTPTVKVSLADLPLAVPLPHSPPASVLSFSSRSTVSAPGAHSRAGSTSSGSRVGAALSSPTECPPSDATLDSTLTENDDDDSASLTVATSTGERTVKAAAKSDRKIADLEITTRSLLAINATLEATAHRQAREIRALRRRLRETRLSLPPRAFRALAAADKDSPDLALGSDDDADPAAFSASDDDNDDSDEDTEDAPPGAGDAAYRRVRALLDALLVDGRAALACAAPAPTKVLSPDEMRRYHAEDEDDGAHRTDGDHHHGDGDTSFDGSETTGDDEHTDDGTSTGEDLEPLSVPTSTYASSTPPPPPIRITQPGEL